MSPELLKIYHNLPPQVRSWAASLWGYKLKWWRYSGNFDKLVEEIHERDSWSKEQWKTFQEERLAFILDRAVKHVPYYRSLWEERRRKGDKSSHELLENWPLLDKEVLREQEHALIADDIDKKKMYLDHTSGSTGKAVNIWLTRESVKLWYALFEVRSRMYYGVSRFDNWAIIGGQLIVPKSKQKPPFWVWNQGLRQLYCSIYHLSPENIPLYLEAMKKHKVQYLYGYSSLLGWLAEEVIRQGLTGYTFKTAISNAEPVFDYQRELVEKAFGCKLRETYGMVEIACAAGECDQGSMHIWPDVGIMEVLENGEAVAPGTSGEEVCTGLVNPDMPLIRYRPGDRVVLKPESETCSCGRSLPLLERIDGRVSDMLVTSEGGRLTWLTFVNDLPVRESQVVQKHIGEITLNYVPGEGMGQEHLDILDTRFKERLGKNTKMIFNKMGKIPLGPNGKYKMVVNEIPEDEIQAVKKSR